MNRDVKVGDKIAVTKVNYNELERVHFAEVTGVDDDFNLWIDIYPPVNREGMLHMLEGKGDEWRILPENPQYDEEETLQHRQAHAYYDDEALSPSYSDAVKAGMTFADYTGVNITEESLDFEPKEEEVLRGITAESLNFEEAPKSDAVNHPSHYNRYSREVIESIKGLCTPEEYRGYLKGNIIKYSARYSGKDGLQDIDKLAKYTQFLKEFEIEMEGE